MAAERAITLKHALDYDRLKNDIFTDHNAISNLDIKNERLQKDTTVLQLLHDIMLQLFHDIMLRIIITTVLI
jgi:hypothetical protein